MAVLRCRLGLVLLAAVEALVDDLAHCILEIGNGNIILMSVRNGQNRHLVAIENAFNRSLFVQ